MVRRELLAIRASQVHARCPRSESVPSLLGVSARCAGRAMDHLSSEPCKTQALCGRRDVIEVARRPRRQVSTSSWRAPPSHLRPVAAITAYAAQQQTGLNDETRRVQRGFSEPSAGLEPATPSLPWRSDWSRDAAQVAKVPADGRKRRSAETGSVAQRSAPSVTHSVPRRTSLALGADATAP